MPKVTKYPRLRTKIYRGAKGQVHVYFVYDMRTEGKPDIRLGSDHAIAIQKWDEIHNKKRLTIGLVQEAFSRWRERELPKYENGETRRGYAKNLAHIEPVFGSMCWDQVSLPILREYLDRRSAKTQGNREMSLFSIVWGKAILWGMTRLPWPASGIKNWKNTESAREFEVTDQLFDAVYEEADDVLRACMDIASATGMRLTDVRTVRMPSNGKLRFSASKTKKAAEFEVEQSPVLSTLVAKRQAMKAHCVMLLCTKEGRQVSAGMLRDRYDEARDKAAAKALKAGDKDLTQAIQSMYLRDMRKRAADLAGDVSEASKLLQHSSTKLTETHYRTKATKLKAVR
jgi:hypothetical protein